MTVLVIEAADDVAARVRHALADQSDVSVTAIAAERPGALSGLGLPVQVGVGARRVLFTKREAEVLGHLAASHGRVVPREELLSRFWGRETRSLDVYIRRVRQKLGASGRAIETVFGIGYRFVEGTLDLSARTSQ